MVTKFGRLLVSFAAAIFVASCTSQGIVVESVDDYGGPPADLSNSVANGDGFLQGMTVEGSPWKRLARWTNRNVWDTDFVDTQVNAQGNDGGNFDQPGAAISYFTGHGVTTHGCSMQACSSTSACTTPNLGAGERLPGTCRYSPFDNPRCCYMVDRLALTRGSGDRFNGQVNYTGGPIRWGESRNSGTWANAGTNGGTNLVVLDISHGVLPPFWNETLRNSFAGVHMVATLMTGGGDTANVSERGAMLAKRWAANDEGSVAQAWLDTMSWLPANLGSACGRVGGGRGFNGCGCHIVVAMDSTAGGAAQKIAEDWRALRNDGYDGKGNNWFNARWQCNYRLTSGTRSAWELP